MYVETITKGCFRTTRLDRRKRRCPKDDNKYQIKTGRQDFRYQTTSRKYGFGEGPNLPPMLFPPPKLHRGKRLKTQRRRPYIRKRMDAMLAPGTVGTTTVPNQRPRPVPYLPPGPLSTSPSRLSTAEVVDSTVTTDEDENENRLGLLYADLTKDFSNEDVLTDSPCTSLLSEIFSL